MKKLIFGCLCVALLSSCSKQEKVENRIQYVKTDTVRGMGEQEDMLFPGKVKAAEDVSVAFRVSGTIQRIFVKQGSYVHRGQLLAQMDARDYQLQLSATQAEYNQVKAEAERVMALYADNSTTANNNDKAVYGLQQITAKLDNHKNQLADTRLYAPFDGYVQECLFQEHETVAAGMPIISMINSGMPEVEINLPASSYMERQNMGNFTCTFDVFPGEVFPLQLISVNQKANANQLYTMRLKINGTSKDKVPAAGMATMVHVTMQKGAGRNLSVPSTAVFNQEGKNFVFVVKNNTLQKKAVNVAELNSKGNAIVSGDIKASDVIVATGVHVLKEGQKVEPLPAVSKTNVGGLL